MNLSNFIAKRLAFSHEKSFTKIIIRFAIASVAVSIAVMIVATCVISGFKNEINNKIFGFWGHIHITDTNISRNFEVLPINKDEPYYAELSNIAGVEYQEPVTILGREVEGKYRDQSTYGGVSHVHPYIVLPGLMEAKEGMQAVLFKGVDGDFDWRKLDRFFVNGRPIDLEKSQADEVVVSQIIANKLKLKVGDKFILSFVRDRKKLRRRSEIVGIYNTGLEEFDKKFILGDISRARQILKWDENQVGGIEVFLDDVRDIPKMTEYIYADVLPLDLYSESIQEKFSSIFNWLELQDVNEMVIYQLMTIVAIINMITVILILILERSRMIGVLKALGAANSLVKKVFLYNAMYIILFGLLIGNLLGLMLIFIQKYTGIMKLDEASYYLDRVPVKLDWLNILMINLGAFTVILLALFIPVILVSKISPIKVLRFD